MQALWAQILSGEANSPGKYSKRTVDYLASLDKSDALLFRALCGFGWYIGQVSPLVFDTEHELYKTAGIGFTELTHLDNIGLIRSSLSQVFKSPSSGKECDSGTTARSSNWSLRQRHRKLDECWPRSAEQSRPGARSTLWIGRG